MRGAAFDAVLAAHWAIEESYLPIITAIAQRWHDAPELVAARQARPLQNARRATVRDGVAIIPITGPIFPRANMMTELSGATSLNMTALDFTAALDDPEVKAILLDIDSPGGVASGIGEFAAQVHAARAVKPIAAYVGGLGASAAYWIATAAGELIASPSALLGSIGVRTAVAVQETHDTQGYRMIEVVSSNAADKAPDPRTDAGRAVIRQALDGIEAEFIADVAKHRGVGADKVKAEFGRGGIVPAREAVTRGMADRIGTFEQTLADLAARVAAAPSTAPRAAASTEENVDMTGTTSAAAAIAAALTIESIARDHPAIAAALRAEGAKAERDRIIGVQAHALLGHEALIEAFIADGKTTPDEAARAIVQQEKRLGRALLGAFAADSAALDGKAPAAPAPAAEASAATLAAMPVEERCKAEWERDAKLREEFGTLGVYTAFRRAEGNGQVKLLRRAG